jgi:hypothetical protein
MVSPRLLSPDGRLGHTLADNYDTEKKYVMIEKRRLPTACIAFINDGTKFDEMFIGSGFEDDDFCKQLSIRYPDGLFVINNMVKLAHLNEQKNQGGKYWETNRRYFLKKWPDEPNRWNVGSLD